LTQIEFETLGASSSLSVKGYRRNGTGHEGNAYAGTETMWRGQNGVFTAEAHVGP
jgi:hypothetical protein